MNYQSENKFYSWQCPYLNFKVPYYLVDKEFYLFTEHIKQLNQANTYGITHNFEISKNKNFDEEVATHLKPISYDEAILQIRTLCRYINKQKGIGSIDDTREVENNFKNFFEIN